MHILVVTQYFWPENFRINDLVSDWLSRGYRVTVLTGQPSYPNPNLYDDYKKSPLDYISFSGARVVRVPTISRNAGFFKIFLNYMSFIVSGCTVGILKLRKLQPDAIFVFGPSPIFVCFPAILLSKLKRIPIIFWVLDAWPDTLSAVNFLSSRRLLQLIGVVVGFIYKKCHVILGQSRSLCVNIKKYCGDSAIVEYLPSWSEDFGGISGVELAPQILEDPTVFTVLFTGNFGDAQDIASILDAAELLKDDVHLRWVLVGGGRKFEWTKQEVVNRGLEKCVLLPGMFPLSSMPSFYAHADVLLVSLTAHPAFEMIIPGKIQAYLRTGLPIIGMLNGEGADVIQRAKAGITCNAGDVRGLVEAIRRLKSCSAIERLEMGASGLAFSELEFDRKMVLARLDSILIDATRQ